MLLMERAAIVRRAAEVMERRQDEIVEWLIHVSGSTRLATDHWVTVQHDARPDPFDAAAEPAHMPGAGG
jgi:aldehyde dehydrogenase (NAD+)